MTAFYREAVADEIAVPGAVLIYLTFGADAAISEGDAISIDKCEKVLLQANYPAIREAISKHLTEISKKKLKNRGKKEF